MSNDTNYENRQCHFASDESDATQRSYATLTFAGSVPHSAHAVSATLPPLPAELNLAPRSTKVDLATPPPTLVVPSPINPSARASLLTRPAPELANANVRVEYTMGWASWGAFHFPGHAGIAKEFRCAKRRFSLCCLMPLSLSGVWGVPRALSSIFPKIYEVWVQVPPLISFCLDIVSEEVKDVRSVVAKHSLFSSFRRSSQVILRHGTPQVRRNCRSLLYLTRTGDSPRVTALLMEPQFIKGATTYAILAQWSQRRRRFKNW